MGKPNRKLKKSEELKNLSYQDRFNLLHNNPVLVARLFQYKVELFFKKIILDAPVDKTKHYLIPRKG